MTSLIERSFDPEWHYLSQFNWEWKVTIVSRITCNRIQLNNFLNWRIIAEELPFLEDHLIWNNIITFNSIVNQMKQLNVNGCSWTTYSFPGGAIDLEWLPFNWESNETIICKWMQLNNFLSWRILWSGMTLSLSIQLRIKWNNYM